MSTSYAEIAKHRTPSGHPVEEQWLGSGQFIGKRWVQVAWDDRYAMVDYLGQMNYGAGQLWPYNTATGAFLYGARCVGTGRGHYDADGLAHYDSALIELHYSTMAPVVFGGGYVVSESIEPMKFYQKFPTEFPDGTQLIWDNDPDAKIKVPLDFLDCRMVYVLAFHNIQAAPLAALSYIGGCNQQAMPTLTLGVQFAKTTLLHADPYINRTIRPGFVPRMTLRYRWMFHPHGWNKKWDPKTGGWKTVYHPTEGQVIFHILRDFTALYP